MRRKKSHSYTKKKTIVGVYIDRVLLEKVRNHGLNLSRITEQALSSILDYLETQNCGESSVFLGKASFPKEGLVDGAGFEPAASTMPTQLHLNSDCLEKFTDFLLVNMRLEKVTVRQNIQDARRFLEKSNYVVSEENIKKYLESYIPKAAKTYNTQITSLRRFVRDYLKLPNVIMSFKMAPVDEWKFAKELPTIEQIRKGFEGLTEIRAKTTYLFTATTGLRKGEILALQKDQINFKIHSVIPMHFTRKKGSGITFFNKETSIWLEKYLQTRADDSHSLFIISDRQWKKIWKQATENAGVKVTSKILRAWFNTEMGELGVADRFVDVFQGRAPRSVLAKHYTGKGLERLKRIYDKANLLIFR